MPPHYSQYKVYSVTTPSDQLNGSGSGSRRRLGKGFSPSADSGSPGFAAAEVKADFVSKTPSTKENTPDDDKREKLAHSGKSWKFESLVTIKIPPVFTSDYCLRDIFFLKIIAAYKQKMSVLRKVP